MKSLLNITDLTPEEIQKILDTSIELEQNPKPILKGKNIVFAFEKPSLRTKVGSEVAINKLGGSVIHTEAGSFFGGNILHAGEHNPSGKREDLVDTIKNVSQWCDAIFARVYSHDTLVQLSEHGSIPAVNALCDQHHPMQALADFLTIQQNFGMTKRPTITFVGDANNVAYSLIECGLKLGYPMQFSGPAPYYWNQSQLKHFEALAKKHQTSFMHSDNVSDVIAASEIIYTDTFVSMGEESTYDEKMTAFKDFQVNETLMNQAQDGCKFMHCLPAHRNIEVTDAVIDSNKSLVYQQAKNRMVTSLGVFAIYLSE